MKEKAQTKITPNNRVWNRNFDIIMIMIYNLMDLLPLDLTGFNPLQLVELKLLRFKVSTYEHPFTNDIIEELWNSSHVEISNVNNFSSFHCRALKFITHEEVFVPILLANFLQIVKNLFDTLFGVCFVALVYLCFCLFWALVAKQTSY